MCEALEHWNQKVNELEKYPTKSGHSPRSKVANKLEC